MIQKQQIFHSKNHNQIQTRAFLESDDQEAVEISFSDQISPYSSETSAPHQSNNILRPSDMDEMKTAVQTQKGAQQIGTQDSIELNFWIRFKNADFKNQLFCQNQLEDMVKMVRQMNCQSCANCPRITAIRSSMILKLFRIIQENHIKCLQTPIFHHLKQFIGKMVEQAKNFNFQEVRISVLRALNGAVNTMIQLIYVLEKPVPFEALNFVFENFEKFCLQDLKTKKEEWPTSYWILKLLIENRYHEAVLAKDNFSKIKIEMEILRQLDSLNTLSQSKAHQDFVFHFLTKIDLKGKNKQNPKYNEEETDFIIKKIVKASISCIINLKGQDIMFKRGKFTFNCIMALYHRQELLFAFNIFQQLVLYLNQFPNQNYIKTFCLIYQGIETFELRHDELSYFNKLIKTLKKYQAQEFTLLTLYLLHHLLKNNKRDPDMLSCCHLKNFTVRFSRLNSQIKKKFLIKYFQVFVRFFSKFKRQGERKVCTYKMMRMPFAEDFENEKNLDFKHWLKQIDKINGKMHKKSITFNLIEGVDHNGCRQKLIQRKLSTKVQRLMIFKKKKPQQKHSLGELTGLIKTVLN